MTSVKFLVVCSTAAWLAAGCGDDDNDHNHDQLDAGMISNVIDVTADISTDTTWSSDKTYVLKSNVFVRNATLTIEAGTMVKGDPNSSLVVSNTAQINATGSAQAPIVFTSNQPVGSQSAGDWGGIVLLGKAPINVSGGRDSIEGFPAGTSGVEFGGSSATHDCGTLKYVRIEFAGFELSTDNELNGLTVGGCGSQTELDYIQVHKGADDGIEFFGGTADLKHAVITQPDDDGLDWDFGWTGRVQYIIIQQNAIVGNNAIEADSNKNDNDASPRSAPVIWNATFVGSDSEPGAAGKYQQGIHFRRGTAAQIHNMVMVHFADSPIDIDGDASVAQANAGALVVKNSIFFDNANSTTWPAETGDDNNDSDFDENAFFHDADHSNRFMDPQLSSATNLASPNFAPASDSPAMSSAGTPPGGFFDAGATYVGAVSASVDWTSGWTAYP